MSTVAEPPKANGAKAQPVPSTQAGQVIEFVPLGETAPITLTLARVKQYLCTPTKSGKLPTDEQVIKFMMMCKAGSLNPWVNDAYLVGYDGKDGPTFSLITAHQALLKRAEASPDYDGMESGVIVLRGDAITERQGDLVLKGEELVGAWARVYRRDRKVPSYDAINLDTYDKQRSLWNSDKSGMIVKCAQASALRAAFPSTLAAMYCREEMDRIRDEPAETQDTRSKAERLAAQFAPTVSTAKHVTHEPAPQTFIPATERETVPVTTSHRETSKHEQQDRQTFTQRIDAAKTAAELDLVADDLDIARAKGMDDAALMEINEQIATQRNELKKT